MKTINSMVNSLAWMIAKEKPHKELRKQLYAIQKAMGFYAAYNSGQASGKRSRDPRLTPLCQPPRPSPRRSSD